MPNQTELRKKLTDQILSALNEGVLPWKQPWSNDPCCGRPLNADTQRPYQGVNILLLNLHNRKYLSTGRYFATYKQWQAMGGQVIARPTSVPSGEWGAKIVFYKPVTKTKINRNGEEVEDKFCVMRTYTVFNIEQVKGKHLDHLRAGYCASKDPEVSIREVDELVKNAGVDIMHGGNRAYYDPSLDIVRMPSKHQFEDHSYYETLLHEICHWAEHPNRLNWDRSKKENSYAMGELVAEMGACFLCSELGIPFAEGLENHVAYVKSWAEKLEEWVSIDPNFILRASTQASKVCDYVLQFRPALVEESAVA
jgi:antirestriction protein ArdC